MTSRMVQERVMELPTISVLTAMLTLSLEFPAGTRIVHTPNYMKDASNKYSTMIYNTIQYNTIRYITTICTIIQ